MSWGEIAIVALVAINSLPFLAPVGTWLKGLVGKLTGKAPTLPAPTGATRTDTSHPYAVLDQLDGVLKQWQVPSTERKSLLTPIHEALWGKVT